MPGEGTENLQRLLLEGVVNGSVRTAKDIHALVTSTLLSRLVPYALLHKATLSALGCLR